MFASIAILVIQIPVLPKPNDPAALGTLSGFIGRRILKDLEIEFVSPIPDIHLSRNTFLAFFAGLPITFVLLRVVQSAKSISSMISIAAVPGVGKHHVLMGIITDPVATAIGSSKVLPLST